MTRSVEQMSQADVGDAAGESRRASGGDGLPLGGSSPPPMSTRHTEMFRPAAYYAEQHEDNGTPDNGGDAFYFVVNGADPDVGGRLSGYVNREQFNWLAERLGTPPLSSGPSDLPVCKGSRCPEPRWCGPEKQCLWDRWNKSDEEKPLCPCGAFPDADGNILHSAKCPHGGAP